MLCRGLKSRSKRPKNSYVAIGNFDGMHLGHQALLKNLVNLANAEAKKCFVILFEPHPKEYFNVQGNISRIMSLRQKYEYIIGCGVDAVICLKFNKELTSMSHHEFYQNVLRDRLGIRGLVLGEDFRFGKNRLGDIAFLKQKTSRDRLSLTVLPQLLKNNQVVSSTLLRHLIRKGDFSGFKKLTGRCFSLSGNLNKAGEISLGDKYLPLNGCYEAICCNGCRVNIVIRSLAMSGKRYITISPISYVNFKPGSITISILAKITSEETLDFGA